MQDELKIAFIQTDLVWENPEQNRHNFAEKIKSISQSVDLIILPEMFTTGFTMNAKKCAESMEGETIEWLKVIALKSNASIIGSVIIEEENKYYNRLLFVHPEGTMEYYNKHHTFA